MTKVAHISDIHLGPLPRISPFQLMNKRLTGYANWKLARHANMASGLLTQLTDHLRAQTPNLIAVSGDLVNLALPMEFEAAKTWLEELGPSNQVAVIPGNHDAYLLQGLETATEQWGEYMKGMTLSDQQFPFWRQEAASL